VHEEPKYDDEPGSTAAPDLLKEEEAAPEQPAKPVEKQAQATQQPNPKKASATPAGAIVSALFVMAVLAALTVMVYLQS
jgi:hypothetical protein